MCGVFIIWTLLRSLRFLCNIKGVSNSLETPPPWVLFWTCPRIKTGLWAKLRGWSRLGSEHAYRNLCSALFKILNLPLVWHYFVRSIMECCVYATSDEARHPPPANSRNFKTITKPMNYHGSQYKWYHLKWEFMSPSPLWPWLWHFIGFSLPVSG